MQGSLGIVLTVAVLVGTTQPAMAASSANEIPVQGEPPNVQWSRYIRLEGTLMQAIWDCRKDSYKDAVSLLPELLSQFEETRADEISKAAVLWQDRKKRASEIGWSPGNPLAEVS
jgi:hypothetical protein